MKKQNKTKNKQKKNNIGIYFVIWIKFLYYYTVLALKFRNPPQTPYFDLIFPQKGKMASILLRT